MRGNGRSETSSVHEIAWSHGSKGLAQRSEPLAGIQTKQGLIVPDPAAGSVVIIENRALFRECFTRCMKQASGQDVISFSSVESWLEAADEISASLVILCIAGKASDVDARREISLLAQSNNRTPTIILSDVEDPDQIVAALERGARGYIPTSVSLEIAMEAMHLVRAGGVFVPASSLIAARRSNDSAMTSASNGNGMFTARQVAVIEALRRGKANKVIAHELAMRESTVKVHVRNIMKKLKARNRTEVAFLINELAESKGG